MTTLVSRNIRYLRRLHGLTQEEFANKIGIKRPSLGAYEESRATPSVINLQIIAKAFDISVDDLIGLDIRLIKELRKENLSTESLEISSEILLENIENEIFIENFVDKKIVILEDLEKKQKEAQEIINKNLVKDLEEKLKINQQEKIQNTVYPTLEKDFFSPQNTYNQENNQQNNQNQKAKNDIPFVKILQRNEYLANYDNPSFVANLPQLNLSLLAENEQDKANRDLRAFEMGEDFPQLKTVLIAEYSKNWYNLQDNYYVIVSQRQGIFYAKVENLLKTENYLKITSNDGADAVFRLPLREIFEIWQPILMISAHFPEIMPNPNTKLYALISELQNEIERLKR